MWNIYEPWQISMLERLGLADRERLETMLNTVWNSYPGIFEDLAIAAVDQEQLSIQECAKRLNISPKDVEEKLVEFRKANRFRIPENQRNSPDKQNFDFAVVMDHDFSTARLAEARISVWEVIREFRKLGSIEGLEGAFPGTPRNELLAAIHYAEANPVEIQAEIEKYEEMLAQRRKESPYTRHGILP